MAASGETESEGIVGSPAQPSSIPIRRKKIKLLPTLLWAGLAYATFCEKSSQIGAPITTAEALDGTRVAAAGVKGRSDHDLAIFDDSNNDEIHGFDGPNSLSRIGGSDDIEEIPNIDGDYDNDDLQNDSAPTPPGIIVVATVDGTLAGISKETGKILWKQSEDVANNSASTSSSSLMKQHARKNRSFQGDISQILKPLVSTTTTTKSASDASYKAVPSVDGTIYTTTNELSMTTSVKDLVARSPFLDPRGKFYMGSRYASAAALDGETGQVLRVISSSTNSASSDEDISSLPDLEGRNVIWIGRVDHEVSVQDAKTGMIDAQFSVAEVMSVADMHGMMGNDLWKPEPALYDGSSPLSSPNAVAKASAGDIDLPSTIVATPNGNVALWNFEDSKFSWVANEAFDSPIAYAMDSTTGFIMGVDIVPDVTDPNASIDDLTKEMERQSEMASLTDTPVVGAMPNGQLYALPLRRKRSASMIKMTNGGATVIASTSSAAAAAASSGSSTKPSKHTVSHLPGRSSVKLSQIDTNNNHQQQQQQHYLPGKSSNPEYNPSGKSGTVVVKKPCLPTSSTYPACLLENDGNRLSDSLPAITGGNLETEKGSLVVASSDSRADGGFIHPKYGYISPQDFGGFLHPVYGYVSPLDLFGNKRSDKNKFRRYLSSWLPPTMALLIVISFELGRRKRFKDDKKGQQSFFLTSEQMDKINGMTLRDVKFADDQRDMDKSPPQEVISVSEEVLGYGGHGTVVYKGLLDGRNVAVKRMLKAYHASADREISLLIESDGDPNVVRYFLKEVRGDFVYLALELCDLSLHELIGVLREQQQEQGIPIVSNPYEAAHVLSTESMNATVRILFQIASGVKHLHSLRIVHRDLKPANILLAVSKGGKKKVKEDDPIFNTFVQNYYDAKISDMGLGKQLIGQSSIGASFIGESSFRGNKPGSNSIGVGPGTVGWQAPEVMAMRLTSDTSARSMDSSNPNGESKEFNTNDPPQGVRTSRSVDIFSLGCIFYSILIPGHHPFGEWFEREANIMHNRPNLDPLKKISMEAYHLISSMLQRNPKLRPTAMEVCQHPFFWNSQKKLVFLCDFSDRLETDLIAQSSSNAFNSLAIERGAADVVGTSWETKLDGALIDNVQKFRTYDYSCVRDLLRLIRNKHHHFEELPEAFRMSTTPNQDALYDYFSKTFPALTMHCYSFCGKYLTEDDQLMSKFDISLAKFDTVDLSSAPVSVTLKKNKIVSDDDIAPTDEIGSALKPEETQCTPVDDITAEVVTDDESSTGLDEGIIVWEGSIAAKTYNCRGWHRSEDEWSRHIEPFYKKRDPASKRCMEDPKFRTRLCNHWDTNLGTFCPMKKKNKCVFAHGPAELRVKEGKKNRWGKLVDKNGNNSNPWHSGGEDTFGAASTIEKVRKEEGKWNASKDRKKNPGQTPRKKRAGTPAKPKTAAST